MNNILNYLNEIQSLFYTEKAREHAYRPALSNLLQSINSDPNTKILNDPSRSEHGAPDFLIMRGNDLIIAHIETKDLNVDLDKTETSEQLQRYYGYTNLLLTDYLDFRFFKNGEKTETISIGKITDGKIILFEEHMGQLEYALKDFISGKPETIRSGLQLAKIMGGKARRIRDNVRRFLEIKSESNQELDRIYEVIKNLLIHDLSKEKFADMYAQTLVYGLFIARYHDESEENFTRAEARDLVPESNPFLKTFFDHIAGNSFDKRLAYIVNELCEIFCHSDVQGLMSQYSKQLGLFDEDKESPDPVIHFYEDFLKEYDAKQRVELGVFYTPLPVVRFIVRSIDEILKKEFGLEKGLADSSKIERTIIRQGQKVKETLHRVQVLDPATGTGTFLNEVINQIYSSFKGQEGRWKSYVNDDLLPRIYGFELMMASYTIAHLKLGLNLSGTGYKEFNRRIGVYLTNSLEDAIDVDNTLFAPIGLPFAISKEAEAAGIIKNKKPIMVVTGNPPYSISSSNKGEWIQNLIKDYKKDLNERKINLDDDYIKFIRFAEHFIEKNKSGIVAMITNNSYIDGITHRQMRKHLLETFDDIYILNLHGDSRKKEKTPDGGKDENVFDIQQGVAISIFVRKSSDKKGLGKIHYSELFGKRRDKFQTLNEKDILNIKWQKLNCSAPYYFFSPKDFSSQDEFYKNFMITDLFINYSAGIKTKIDKVATDFNREVLAARIEKILDNKPSLEEIIRDYHLNENTTWEYKKAIDCRFDESKIRLFSYRPFDYRYVYFDHNFLSRSRRKVMDNVAKSNFTLSFTHQGRNYGPEALITREVTCEDFITNHTFTAPLYINNMDSLEPNLKRELLHNFQQIVGKLSPEEILEYIYAVLYSPSYRTKFEEFLKIDFPRIPYPKSAEQFHKLAEKGKELQQLHLMESPLLNDLTITYPVGGTDRVEKTVYSAGSIFINSNQYFGNVPEIAWNFYVGGYQPAQKWLKDRKGQILSSEDIEHYQKIIVVLTETNKIMKEIDKLDI